MRSILRFHVSLFLLGVITAILAGCGGGATSYDYAPPSSSGGAAGADTGGATGSIAVVTTVPVSKDVPAATRAIRVTLTRNGVLIVSPGLVNPSTFAVQPGQTQTNVVANVPVGTCTVLVECLDGEGRSVGVSASTATVGLNETATVRVTQVQTVTALAISPSPITMRVGRQQAATATATLSDGTSADFTTLCTWSTSPSTVATVSNAAGSQGFVAGVAAGSATLTSAYAGVTATATVTVSGTAPTPSPSPSPTPSPSTVNVTATRFDTWTQTLSGATARDYAYDPATQTGVVVGDLGLIETISGNGVVTVRHSTSNHGLKGVAFLAGRGWVAVGDNGAIVRSADGVTWTEVAGADNPTPILVNLRGVCSYTNGTASGFIAVGTASGGKGWILHSTDGATWTDVSYAGNNDNYSAVATGAIGASTFVEIVGDQSCPYQQLPTDAGPTMPAWASATSTHGFALAVTYAQAGGSGFFVLSGEGGWVDVNVTGTGWAAASTPQIPSVQSIYGVAYGRVGSTDTLTFVGENNGVPVSFVDSTFTAANTGHTYTPGSQVFPGGTPALNAPMLAARFGGGQFHAVANGASHLTSPDGQAYTVAQYAPEAGVNAIAVGVVNGAPLYVAVGDAFASLGWFQPLIETSTDGVTWTRRSAGALTNNLQGVAFGNGRFVAVTVDGIVIVSTDGVTWTPAPHNALTNQSYQGIAFGQVGGVGHFVVVGNGWIGVGDANGDNWVEAAQGQPSAYGVAYGNVGGTDMFVEVADQGRTAWSTDLVTWTNVTTSQPNALYAVAFLDNLFVAVGDQGRIQTSADGKTFTDRGQVSSPGLYGVTAVATPNAAGTATTWLAVGDSGPLFRSSDGVTWSPIVNPNLPFALLRGVAASSTSQASLDPGTNVTTVTWTTQFVIGGTANTMGVNQ